LVEAGEFARVLEDVPLTAASGCFLGGIADRPKMLDVCSGPRTPIYTFQESRTTGQCYEKCDTFFLNRGAIRRPDGVCDTGRSRLRGSESGDY
jgi:hypothetical protein